MKHLCSNVYFSNVLKMVLCKQLNQENYDNNS